MDKKTNQLSIFLGIENGRLSSKSTFFGKYIWAPIWILGYWPIAIACAWNRLDWQGTIMLFIPWLIMSIYFYYTLIRIKKVILSGSKFIVSNYRKEITIDISDIDSVGGSIFLNPELIWLNLKKDSEFGKKIVFAPDPRSTFNIYTGLTKHPLVAKLKNLNKIVDELKM